MSTALWIAAAVALLAFAGWEVYALLQSPMLAFERPHVCFVCAVVFVAGLATGAIVRGFFS